MWSLRGGTLVPQRLGLASPLSVTLSGTRLLGLVCRGDQQLTGFGCPGFASKKNGPARVGLPATRNDEIGVGAAFAIVGQNGQRQRELGEAIQFRTIHEESLEENLPRLSFVRNVRTQRHTYRFLAQQPTLTKRSDHPTRQSRHSNLKL